jgi:hypothetical protein
MAVLDFPSSPTLNQKYNAASGASYTWDGAAWTLGGPITASPVGAAGGSLNGTYPNPGLVPGVGVRGIVGGTFPVSFSSGTVGTWLKVLDLPVLTTHGGSVLVLCHPGANIQATVASSVILGVGKNLAQPTWTWEFDIGVVIAPCPGVDVVDQPVAGTLTYSFWVYQGGSTAFKTPTNNTGNMYAMEFA